MNSLIEESEIELLGYLLPVCFGGITHAEVNDRVQHSITLIRWRNCDSDDEWSDVPLQVIFINSGELHEQFSNVNTGEAVFVKVVGTVKRLQPEGRLCVYGKQLVGSEDQPLSAIVETAQMSWLKQFQYQYGSDLYAEMNWCGEKVTAQFSAGQTWVIAFLDSCCKTLAQSETIDKAFRQAASAYLAEEFPEQFSTSDGLLAMLSECELGDVLFTSLAIEDSVLESDIVIDVNYLPSSEIEQLIPYDKGWIIQVSALLSDVHDVEVEVIREFGDLFD